MSANRGPEEMTRERYQAMTVEDRVDFLLWNHYTQLDIDQQERESKAQAVTAAICRLASFPTRAAAAAGVRPGVTVFKCWCGSWHATLNARNVPVEPPVDNLWTNTETVAPMRPPGVAPMRP